MGRSHGAILAPLLGLGLGWVLFMFASWSNLFVQPVFDSSGFVSDGPSVKPSTYLYLLGITLYSLGAFLGLRLSSKERATGDSEDSLAMAAYRLGNLAVIIGLAGAAIFAIGNFLGALGNRDSDSLGSRFLGCISPSFWRQLSSFSCCCFLRLSPLLPGDLRHRGTESDRAAEKLWVGDMPYPSWRPRSPLSSASSSMTSPGHHSRLGCGSLSK